MKAKRYISYLMGLVLILGFSSCQVNVIDDDYGRDGRDGDAYLALEWRLDEPEYIEIGNNSFPVDFYWNTYYHVWPGTYTFYYDGEYFNGRRWVDYAWELRYDVWVELGEEAGYRYDGMDGRNSYFTIECNPDGPYYFEELKSTKNLPKGYSVVNETEDSIIVNQTVGSYKAKLIYKKVPKRSK